MYSSTNIIRMIKIKSDEIDKACSTHGAEVHTTFTRKPGGKRPLGRPKCRLEDNIKMDAR